MKILIIILGLITMFSSYAEEKIILITDPSVLSILIHENHDPLIDLAFQKEIAYGPPPITPNNSNYTKIRKKVYENLIKAQALLPEGLKFCLYEGYRSLDLQQKIFDGRYSKLKKEYPSKTHQEIFIETTKFASPLINLDGSTNIPPHSTGGAIDVYLIDKEGKFVDMGIHLDDTYNDLDGKYCKTDSDFISKEAKENRRIMSKALEAVGFINYPTEYWHWSYGDRYWALHTKNPYALYNSIPNFSSDRYLSTQPHQ